MKTIVTALLLAALLSLPASAETVFLETVNFSEDLRQCAASKLYAEPLGLNDISAIELGEEVIIRDINTQSRFPYGTRKVVVAVRYDISGLIYNIQVFKAESGSWRRIRNLGDFKFISESETDAICERIVETTVMSLYK